MNVVSGSYANSVTVYTSTRTASVNTAAGDFSDAVKKSSPDGRESAVEKYKNRHPEYANLVNNQVNAGKAVLKKNGAENICRQDMSMEEYKQFFTELMNSIPFDASRMGDTEVWSITEQGWEQMKNDPDYEAWVLGYTVENRSVRDPFPGNWHCMEKFGASIDEHLGQTISADDGKKKTGSDDDEESWWVKRHRRIEELIREHAKMAQEKGMIQRKMQQSQRIQEQIAKDSGLSPYGQAGMAAGIYESVMDMVQ